MSRRLVASSAADDDERWSVLLLLLERIAEALERAAPLDNKKKFERQMADEQETKRRAKGAPKKETE